MSKAQPNGSVIVITDDVGEEKPWRPLAARVLQVLEAYPPKEGWGIIIEPEPSKVQFLNEYGQPEVTVMFTARLVSPDGKTVATGSSLWPINGPEAWPIGESRARHRLCAALGFGGEVLDEDERQLLLKLAREGRPAAGTQGQATTATTPVVTPTAPQAAPAPPATAPAVPASAPRAEKHATRPGKRPPGAPSPLLIKQIQERANLLGVAVPECNTEDEAKAVWKQLLSARPGG